MTNDQFSRLVHESLRTLRVENVRIDRKFDTDEFVCTVKFAVYAEDEIGVFSALHTVVVGVTEHLMHKYSTRNNT